MAEFFARLETIDDRQILAELDNSDDGPRIRMRRDDGISCQATLGPWPDTEEGWEKAEEALAKMDMNKAAENLDDIIAKLMKGGKKEPTNG
jgi:hypothetical protein